MGWVDPQRPAVQKDAGLHEFRMKLSEIPQTQWKKVFSELNRDQMPRTTIEQDVMVLSCELTEIEQALGRIKQRLAQVNETINRQERATDERVARQMVESEALRAKILAAVKNIRFDD
ncbi:MAG: hypothetical protein P4L83_12690 [Nevskia sp.]|nr:hypothetical protein [Nevskia sp.]